MTVSFSAPAPDVQYQPIPGWIDNGAAPGVGSPQVKSTRCLPPFPAPLVPQKPREPALFPDTAGNTVTGLLPVLLPSLLPTSRLCRIGSKAAAFLGFFNFT